MQEVACCRRKRAALHVWCSMPGHGGSTEVEEEAEKGGWRMAAIAELNKTSQHAGDTQTQSHLGVLSVYDASSWKEQTAETFWTDLESC